MVGGVGEDIVEFFVDVVDVELTVGNLAQLLIDLVFDTWDKLAVLYNGVKFGFPFLQILDLIFREVIGKELCNERLSYGTIVTLREFFHNCEDECDFFVPGDYSNFLADIKDFVRIDIEVIDAVLDLIGVNVDAFDTLFDLVFIDVRYVLLDFVRVDINMWQVVLSIFEGDSGAHHGHFNDISNKREHRSRIII